MSHRIDKQIELAAPQSRVWQAITDSRQFGAWFGVTLEEPFVLGHEVGGEIAQPNSARKYPRMLLTVQAIEPETLFSFTWHPNAVDFDVDYSQETPTLVEFHLKPTATGTLLRVSETGFEHLPSHRRDECLLRNARGWEIQLERIETYVGHA